MFRQFPLPFAFHPGQGFDDYHPGVNVEAVEHLRLAALGRGEPLIFLWGEHGLGKTHLLNACCQEAHRAGLSVSYLPLGNLRDHGVDALEGLELQNLVCLDDADAVAGDESLELALFALFNRLRDAGVGMILTAQSPPEGLRWTLPDLKTRLSWGLTLMLRPLSDEDKLASLSLQARRRGFDLPPAVGRFLLGTYRRDMASLVELLERLDDATLATKRKLTIPFLKSFLEEDP